MTKDLTGKVKPCPMCGSERIYLPFPEVNTIYSVRIQCADCGLNGFVSVMGNVDIDDAMERVIKYWNTRSEGSEEE